MTPAPVVPILLPPDTGASQEQERSPSPHLTLVRPSGGRSHLLSTLGSAQPGLGRDQSQGGPSSGQVFERQK